ncbi:MAG: class I SAM-dependent methyltransferase [Candidatus Caldarchaeum sp.]
MRGFPIEPHKFRIYKARLVSEYTVNTGRVLEVGCGLRHYKRFCRAAEYVGIDLNTSLRPDVWASADHLPFRETCLDLVIMFDVIEHVSDVDSALAEAARVLRHNGKVLLTTPNTLGFGIYDSYADKTHKHHFTWQSMEKILSLNGLRVVKRIPLHLHIFWPFRVIHSKILLRLQQSICLVAQK